MLAERGGIVSYEAVRHRLEVSHQPPRQRARHMRRVKSARHVHRFLSVHSPINHLFRSGRRLMKAAHYRWLRAQTVTIWHDVTAGLTA